MLHQFIDTQVRKTLVWIANIFVNGAEIVEGILVQGVAHSKACARSCFAAIAFVVPKSDSFIDHFASVVSDNIIAFGKAGKANNIVRGDGETGQIVVGASLTASNVLCDTIGRVLVVVVQDGALVVKLVVTQGWFDPAVSGPTAFWRDSTDAPVTHSTISNGQGSKVVAREMIDKNVEVQGIDVIIWAMVWVENA